MGGKVPKEPDIPTWHFVCYSLAIVLAAIVAMILITVLN